MSTPEDERLLEAWQAGDGVSVLSPSGRLSEVPV